MPETNPLVAQRKDTTTPLAGTFLLEDGEALVQAINDKDWVAGGLALVGGAFDAAAAVSDPIGTLIAMGLGWVLDHVQPFNTWLEQLTGDADQVTAHAATWKNVQKHLQATAEAMASHVTTDLADMNGRTITAYHGAASDITRVINAAGTWAGAIGTALEVTAFIVQFVHDFVRDAISEVVGSILSYAAELIATFGLAWPIVAEQIATRVASLIGQVGRNVKNLVTSARNLVKKLTDLKTLFHTLKNKLDDLFKNLHKTDTPTTHPGNPGHTHAGPTADITSHTSEKPSTPKRAAETPHTDSSERVTVEPRRAEEPPPTDSGGGGRGGGGGDDGNNRGGGGGDDGTGHDHGDDHNHGDDDGNGHDHGDDDHSDARQHGDDASRLDQHGKPIYGEDGKPLLDDRGDGLKHYYSDPEGTFRNKSGGLQEIDSRHFHSDPYADAAKEIDHHANKLTTETYECDPNSDFHDKIAHDNEIWDAQRTEKRNMLAIGDEALEKAKKFGIEGKDYRSAAEELHKKLDSLDPASTAEAAKLRRALLDADAAPTKLQNTSEWAGDRASYHRNEDLGRDTILGVPSDRPLQHSGPGRGELDAAAIEGDHTLVIPENKGGDNPQLSDREIADGTRAEQGSPEYLIDLLTGKNQDSRLIDALEQARASGKHDQFFKNLAEGRVEIVYEMVNARTNGSVRVTPFDLGGTMKMTLDLDGSREVKISIERD